MTKEERAEFLLKMPVNNTEKAAQQIARLGSDRRYQITIGLKRLKEVLGCAKELTLNDLLAAMEMIK
jgi:hypothetical protein